MQARNCKEEGHPGFCLRERTGQPASLTCIVLPCRPPLCSPKCLRAQDFDAPSWYYGYNGNSNYRNRYCHNRNGDRYDYPNGDYVFISITTIWCASAQACLACPSSWGGSRLTGSSSSGGLPSPRMRRVATLLNFVNVPSSAACCGQAALNGCLPGDASRYNSFLGGPYFNGYNGFTGTVRITLTLAVVPSFQEAVIVNNRVGRGGVSPQARQVRLCCAAAALLQSIQSARSVLWCTQCNG